MPGSAAGRRWHEPALPAHGASAVNPKPAPRGARFPARLDHTAPGASAKRPATLRPQAPLQHAARDAAQQHRPSGLGMDSAAVRQALVQRLRAELHCHDAVIAAMRSVPRHHFVDSALATQAYEDTSLPIGLGQTISKPSVVARMLSILHEGMRARALGSLGRVLEIGTGCGYQTALLGQMAQRVLSVERLKPLHDKARVNLGEQRAGHIRLVYGDGRLGHPPNAPYDSIIAAAGGSELPAAWIEQLADGGRLVAPMEGRNGQVLLVVDRQGDELRRSMHEAVHFVPLKSGIE
jgi:protein-L-isoaspartate(D-aspartate) O-methyltransferase